MHHTTLLTSTQQAVDIRCWEDRCRQLRRNTYNLLWAPLSQSLSLLLSSFCLCPSHISFHSLSLYATILVSLPSLPLRLCMPHDSAEGRWNLLLPSISITPEMRAAQAENRNRAHYLRTSWRFQPISTVQMRNEKWGSFMGSRIWIDIFWNFRFFLPVVGVDKYQHKSHCKWQISVIGLISVIGFLSVFSKKTKFFQSLH